MIQKAIIIVLASWVEHVLAFLYNSVFMVAHSDLLTENEGEVPPPKVGRGKAARMRPLCTLWQLHAADCHVRPLTKADARIILFCVLLCIEMIGTVS